LASISIGVPVYNEERFLARALEQLRVQSFSDIEVLIFDNASSDGTAGIAQDFVKRDARFSYFRQPENKGPLPNFVDALEAASSDYFMWKAADDEIPVDYVEALWNALQRDPAKAFAAPEVIACSQAHATETVLGFPDLGGLSGARLRWRLLFGSHAAWIYGLFRREALLRRTRHVLASYGHEWAFDHLVMFPFLLDNSVVFARQARFRQVIKAPKASASSGDGRKVVRALTLMTRLRAAFLRIARQDLAERGVTGAVGLIDRIALLSYVGKRVFPLRRLLRLRFRRDVLRRPEIGPF